MSGNAPVRESAIRAAAALVGSRLTVVGGLAILLAALMLGAALVGAYPISLAELAAALGRRLSGAPGQDQVDTVLFEVRLPRVPTAPTMPSASATASPSSTGAG